MRLKKYKQIHAETCLARSLMILAESTTSKSIEDSYELELLIHSLGHGRENIARGHLEKFSSDFNININWVVDSKIFFEFTIEEGLGSKITFSKEKINLNAIDRALLNGPIITYVDGFYLWEPSWGEYYLYHYPHFIVVNKKIGDSYEIIDPNQGELKLINNKILSKGIISLRNRFWMTPQIISFNQTLL